MRPKTRKLHQEDSLPPAAWVAIILLAAAAYGLPALGIGMNELWFLGLTVTATIIAVPSCLAMMRFSEYKDICRYLLLGNPLIINTKNSAKELAQANYRKKIELTEVKTSSNKTGYAYFHEIFVQRHRKLFEKPSRLITIILLVVLLVTILVMFLRPDLKADLNHVMRNYFTYSLLLLYFINRGSVATETMFRNCDQCMLYYSFYRKPKAILALFWERLKTLIKLNLLPATVLAVGFPFLLYFSGGTDHLWEYALILVAVYGMSAFFSIHTLVMYYLLQPYNGELENKSIAFAIVNMLTYFVCYGLAGKQISTILFGVVITGFCVIYIPIALLLVYKLAPKTFRLR